MFNANTLIAFGAQQHQIGNIHWRRKFNFLAFFTLFSLAPTLISAVAITVVQEVVSR